MKATFTQAKYNPLFIRTISQAQKREQTKACTPVIKSRESFYSIRHKYAVNYTEARMKTEMQDRKSEVTNSKTKNAKQQESATRSFHAVEPKYLLSYASKKDVIMAYDRKLPTPCILHNKTAALVTRQKALLKQLDCLNITRLQYDHLYQNLDQLDDEVTIKRMDKVQNAIEEIDETSSKWQSIQQESEQQIDSYIRDYNQTLHRQQKTGSYLQAFTKFDVVVRVAQTEYSSKVQKQREDAEYERYIGAKSGNAQVF